MNLEIYLMGQADTKAVSQIEKERFSQPWSEQGFLDTIYADNVIFAVAKMGGTVVGYGGMYCALDEGEITNVAVTKGYEGKKIATKLLDFLLQEAHNANIRKVVLEVRVSNERAICLYERFGFEKQGIRKDLYQYPREDGYVMVRSQ